ncbi:hypothetical protein KAR10_04145 [bacterium]|nr:hypothetical protein [bacterium]
MGYECFIFAWDVVPQGGLYDLRMCCDTIEEGKIEAEKLSGEYEVVQLMDVNGNKVD